VNDVTRILSGIQRGDPRAADELLPLVYDELRRLAAHRLADEKGLQTLQATALVHEAWLRLMQGDDGHDWNSRGHFFGAAAEAMRRILIDRARDRNRLKREGGRQRISLDLIEVALDTPSDELLALDEALEKLAVEFPECARLVKLRFFAGLSQGDAANALGLPRRTADRHWAFARAWLHRRLLNDVQSSTP
jgi:RNA polymerase sigma factor (TIGR02999 family)